MAYLDSTVLNDFQAREATNEKFEANYGMIDLAKASTPAIDYIPPSVKDMMNTMSGARDAKLPVLKDQTVTVTTTPGFSNIPVNAGETDTYSFTAFDVFSGFRLYPASFENNQVDGEWYRDQIIRNVLKGCAVSIDDIIETQLEARKTQTLGFTTQISQGDGTYVFNGTSDALEISKAAQKETMFYNLSQLMVANQLPGNYRVVTSPGGYVSNDVSSGLYGENNSKNLEWQQAFMPSANRYISDQIATSVNFDGFLVRDGDIGLIENFPWDFRNGTMFAGKEWSITDVEMPYTKMRANVYINKEATEANSIITPSTDTNLTMTHFEEMAVWFRFYVPYRYNSAIATRQNGAIATRQNGIVKLQGKTS
jgi:hypothetical protein